MRQAASFVIDDDSQTTELEKHVRQTIGDTLAMAYPGYDWFVEIKPGAAVIKNLTVEGRWGFFLKLNHASASELRRRVILAGGEMLERYRLRRGRLNPTEVAEVPEDCAGRSIGDLS